MTDNGGAVTRAPSGYIQGYIGMAVSDRKERITVGAQAVGGVNEGGHFPHILDMALDTMKEVGVKTPEGTKSAIIISAEKT